MPAIACSAILWLHTTLSPRLTWNMTKQQTEVAAAAEYEHDLRTVAFDLHKYGRHGPCSGRETVLHGPSWSCLRVRRADAHHRTCQEKQGAAFLASMVCLELAAAEGSSSSDKMTQAHLAQRGMTVSGHCSGELISAAHFQV